MLMLTMNEWYGYGSHYLDPVGRMTGKQPEIRHRGFITALPLCEAVRRIRAYEDAFKDRYGSSGRVMEFELLAVATVPDMTAEEIELSRAVHVERLPQTREDLEAKWGK